MRTNAGATQPRNYAPLFIIALLTTIALTAAFPQCAAAQKTEKTQKERIADIETRLKGIDEKLDKMLAKDEFQKEIGSIKAQFETDKVALATLTADFNKYKKDFDTKYTTIGTWYDTVQKSTEIVVSSRDDVVRAAASSTADIRYVVETQNDFMKIAMDRAFMASDGAVAKAENAAISARTAADVAVSRAAMYSQSASADARQASLDSQMATANAVGTVTKLSDEIEGKVEQKTNNLKDTITSTTSSALNSSGTWMVAISILVMIFMQLESKKRK